jgi:hypothetical protein
MRVVFTRIATQELADPALIRIGLNIVRAL